MTYVTKPFMSSPHPPFPIKKKLNCGKQPKLKLTTDTKLTLNILLELLQDQMQTPSGVFRERTVHNA